MTDITVADLTQTTLDGTGVFDVLMRATKAHLEYEFAQGRIKGTEYATVYLGSLDSVLRTSMEFLLKRQSISLEAQLMEQKIILSQVELLKENATVELLNAEKAKVLVEIDLTTGTNLKTAQETALMLQKVATERAQILAAGVDVDSVVGRQKSLYLAQASGFQRDAEQKAATILADAWKVDKTVSDTATANATNKLDDASLGKAMTKLLSGIGVV